MTRPLSAWSRRAIAHVSSRSFGTPLDERLRITVNFHPDRQAQGNHILNCMAIDGVYRSQFETRTTNAGLTAYPGGPRWWREHRIFGGAYDVAPWEQRPRYGALNMHHFSVGAASRFGSAFFRLRQEVLGRSTFCFPDSITDPRYWATSDRFTLLGAAAGSAVAIRDRGDAGWLDDYVEAQIHGGLNLIDDVEALVLDPCFRGTSIETFAGRIGVELQWHEGRVLIVNTLDRLFPMTDRVVAATGRRIAVGGRIDAQIIGVGS